MPRQARLDASRVLNHVMGRGIERRPALGAVLAAVAAAVGLPPAAVAGTGRSPRVAQARAGEAYLWCRVAGHYGHVLAVALGVSTQAVSAAAARGERTAPRWQAVWRTLQ